MTQAERRVFLIEKMLCEQPRYSTIEVPANEQEQKNLLRSLFNVRMPRPVDEVFVEVQNAYLQEEIRRKGITELSGLKPVQEGLYLWQGDITTLRCDAIVNAANAQMRRCLDASALATDVSTMPSIHFRACSFGRSVGN